LAAIHRLQELLFWICEALIYGDMLLPALFLYLCLQSVASYENIEEFLEQPWVSEFVENDLRLFGDFVRPYSFNKAWNREILEMRNSLTEQFHFTDASDSPLPTIRKLHDYVHLHHDQIKEEVLSLMSTYNYTGIPISDIDPVQYKINDGEIKWTAIWIYFFGEAAGTAHQLPTIKKIAEEMKDEITMMYFSLIWPGSNVLPHTGPSMGVWKYHYGIQIPETDNLINEVRLVLEDGICTWEEKQGFIFDDTLTHSVENNSQEMRMILLADVVRDFPGKWRQLNIDFHKYLRELEHIKILQKKLKNHRATLNSSIVDHFPINDEL
jgi:hypothetical protein